MATDNARETSTQCTLMEQDEALGPESSGPSLILSE